MIRAVILFTCLLFLNSCKTIYVSDADVQYQRVALQSPKGDPEVEEMIQPYQAQLRDIMNEELGVLEVEMIKERPESNIGNWLSDMLFEEVKALNGGKLDFAIQNQGGIRVSNISEGPITRGEIFEVMPFDNKVAILEGNGNEVQAFLDHVAKGGGWPLSAGLTFKIKEDKAIDVSLNGAPLDPERIYVFTVPDYVAGGGSGSSMLKPLKRKDIEVFIRDLYIDHIKKDTQNGQTQTAAKEGRVINLDNE